MKKLAVLISALAILLAACGSKESKEETSSKNESNSSSESSSSNDNSSSDDKVSSSMNAKKAEKKKKPELKDNAVEINGVKTKVLSTEVLPAGTEDYQRKDLLAVKFAITNNSTKDKEVKPGEALYAFEAYQDQNDSEQHLNPGFLFGDKYDKYTDSRYDNIKKGATVETMEFYELKNMEDPVLLKIINHEDYTGDNKIGTIKINIKDAKKEKPNKDKEETTEL
ncbi:DUF5067 domain-containing protein [Staphylococcus debuckii]|uniref:DUF5067 domain-containing protein n=1 Tax=Staphylococcus debuckii TaxID=2044912 RepID=UPI000F434A0C|nr:DUF5067 domain-containing protein [Staphylococcus debuckii]AYU54036.1 DUF5067 domain-containing protein [Staphylococcus debuckii]